MKRNLIIILSLFVMLILYTGFEYVRFNDGKIHVVFCDVGQGDAVLIRTTRGRNILYDSGPDDKVLDCLSKHIPFWDRDISLFILSHPHLDHFAGTFGLLDKYKINGFGTENVDNSIRIYQELRKRIKSHNIPTRVLTAGDSFLFDDGVGISVVGPSKDYIRKTSPTGRIGESKEFASLIVLVKYKDMSIALTGDSQAGGLGEAGMNNDINNIDVLQVPHHGSNTGLNEEVIAMISPKAAVVSVGSNKYGHPGKTIIDLLNNQKIKIFRTDQVGDVEVISDGYRFQIKGSK